MLEVNIESFAYGKKEIIRDIRFQLTPGQHLAVLGESGCGKSTLLHLIYGLLQLEHGSIKYKGEPLLGPSHNIVPGEHFMKLVAQEFNVMPFISVAENIATHLSRMDLEEDRKRVDRLLEVVDLSEFKDTQVKSLSGGQKQRVALAKALANTPEVLLLDEPFSNIDTFRKNHLRRKLFDYLKNNNIACITATHDSEEALAYSDCILILQDGLPIALDSPREVYQQLDSPYQAGFFGEINIIAAGIFTSEEQILLPHQLKPSEEKTSMEVTVVKNYFKGSHYLVEASWNGAEIFFTHGKALKIGVSINLQST